MKVNVYTSIIAIFIGVFVFFGCSANNIKLLKFSYKGQDYFLKIKDVRNDFLLTARRQRYITNDILFHKNFLFSNYLSKEIATIEEIENGITNTTDFKRKYDTLYKKRYYLNLYSKGQEILIKDMKRYLKKSYNYNTLNELEKKEIEIKYVEDFKKKNIEDLYSIYYDKIKLGDKTYSLSKIPDETLLFKIFNIPYSWKSSREIILLFEPDFTNYNIDRFQESIKNLKDLLLGIETARRMGFDKSFSKIIDKDIVKEIALENFREKMRQRFKDEILPKITYKTLKEYYENNKNLAVVEKNGKMIQLTFKDVKDEIYNVVCEEKWQSFVKEWNEEMKKKYNIVYYEDGIKALMKLEINYLSKIFRERGQNLALNKTGSTSFALTESNNLHLALDGKEDTEWHSPANLADQWLYVDIGKQKYIRSVVLKWGKNYPSSLIIQASRDSKNWKDAYYLSNISGGINEVLLEKPKARFIRLYLTEPAYFSLREFEVYEYKN